MLLSFDKVSYWGDEMINFLKNRVDFDYIFTLIIGLAFFYGILSFEHYSPSSADFYINAKVFFLCSLALIVFFIKKNIKIYSIGFFWIFIFLVIFIQPVINHIIYIDGLIFPLACIFVSFLLCIAVKNLENKSLFITKFSFMIFFTSLLLLITQFFHILNFKYILEFMGLPLQVQRFSGNLYQSNQTAFIFVLGIISLLYYFNKKEKNILLKYTLIFILSMGVAFTASRSGFLMLLLGVLVLNLFLNIYDKKKIYFLNDFFVSFSGFLFGVSIYKFFSKTEGILGRAVDIIHDPRWSLMYQSWLVFLDHPLTGIGWKNFAGTGLAYFEKIEWFSLADHSHFIFSHLLSEFGLFGLFIILIFIYFFIKNIRLISSKQDAYLFSILFIFIIYSCFEFPLWYLRYLFVFSIFLSLFDKSDKIYYEIKKGYLLSAVSFFLLIFSTYYIFQYKRVAYISDIVFSQQKSFKEKSDKLLELNSVFGFSYFNDLLLYQTIESDEFLLKDKIEVGNRLVNYIPLNQYLIKQATLLALDGQEKNAIYYFKASCYYDLGKECDSTKAYLKIISLSKPKYFKDIYIEILKTTN